MNFSFVTYQTQKLRPQRILVKLHKCQTTSGPPYLTAAIILKKGKNTVHLRIWNEVGNANGKHLSKQLKIGRRVLLNYRARLTSFEFSNCLTEERSKVEFFCAF